MKILFVCEKIDGSDGWSKHTVNLGNALKERGHEVGYCSKKAKGLPPPLQMLTRPFLAPLVALKLRKRFDELQCDILHITVEPFALAALFLPKRILERTVLTFHGNYGIRPLRFWMTKWLWPSVLRKIPCFITVSHYTKNAIVKELKRIGKEALVQHFEKYTTVIHNGIPLPPKSNEQRTTNNEQRIVHVGGVKPAKGVGEAIMACRFFHEKSDTPFHLSIIGKYNEDNPYFKHLQVCIEEENLENNVSFRGFLSEEDLAEEYRNADLLLVPSYTTETSFEGFGLVYIEANAYGVPVIGPDASGAAEAIKDGVSGFAVHVYDPEQIAERMQWILDEGRIKSEECRKWAEQHDILEVAKKVEDRYSTLIHHD